MTFDEARSVALKEFDEATASLRSVISDPRWCNQLYPKFKESFERIVDAIKAIERLNGVACESERTKEKQQPKE